MKKESFKKVLALALSAIMAWGFVACGVDKDDDSSSKRASFAAGSSLYSDSDSDSSKKNASSNSSADSSSWWDSNSSSDSSADSSSWWDSNSSSDSSSDSSSSEDTEQGVVPYDGSEVKITFYHTMGANLRTVLDKYIPKFNEKYPNITVKHDMMGDYPALRDQISMELTAGRSPSLAYCYPDHVARYNKAKATLPLDGYIASTDLVMGANGSVESMGMSQAQLDDFIPVFFEEGRAYGDGFTYTLPMSKSTEVLYYNKTFFEEYDLDVPTTWEEMEEVCAQIKEIDSQCIPLGYDSEENWFITMTQQLNTPYTTISGDDHFLFNTAENRAFVEKFTTWYQKGYVTTEEILGNYTSEIFTETEAGRMKCYMCIASSAGASYQCPDRGEDGNYPFEVGVAMIPQANPEAPKAIQQGPSLCLFKKENPQEQAAAWLFAKFLTTNVEFQAQFSMTNGYTPVIKSVQENVVYQDFLSKTDGNQYLQAIVIKQSLAQVDAYFTLPAFNGSSVARDEVGKLMQTCFVNAPKDGAAAFIEAEFKKTVDTLVYYYGF